MKTLCLIILTAALGAGCVKKGIADAGKPGTTNPPGAVTPKPPPTQPEVAEKEKPLPEDFESLKALAEKGNPAAQYEVGLWFEGGGKGGYDHLTVALKWFLKAAKNGHPQAQVYLATVYRNRMHRYFTEMNEKEAQKWLRKAAAQGYTTAHWSAEMVEFKLGVDLKKPPEKLTKKDYQKVRSFELIPIYPMFDLKAVPKFTKLREFSCTFGYVTNVSPLTQIPRLQKLELEYHALTNIRPLAKLTQLTELSLHMNQLVKINSLATLTRLEVLYLGDNQVANITPLAKLAKLKELNLSYNKIGNALHPLANLTQLESLGLAKNQVADVAPLAKLTNLKVLNLRYNKISDLRPLSNMTKLKLLLLEDNKISDLRPLSGLVQLDELRLNKNQITDLSPLASLKKLTQIWLGGNPKLTKAEIENFKKALPKCQVILSGGIGLQIERPK